MGNITQYNQVRTLDDLREFTAMVALLTGNDLRVQEHGDSFLVTRYEDDRERQTITTLRRLEDVAEQLERWYEGYRAAVDVYGPRCQWCGKTTVGSDCCPVCGMHERCCPGHETCPICGTPYGCDCYD